MNIRKLKSGRWKATGKRFNVMSIKPNLRKNLKLFMALDDDEHFLQRLERNYPRAKEKKVKLKVEKFGGCWKVRCAETDRLVTIHDLEYVDRGGR